LRALGEYVSWRNIAKLVFLNIFVSGVTPLATGGGVAQEWFLHRHGVTLGTALAATTIRTILAVLFSFGATPVLLLTMPGAESATAELSIVIVLTVCALLYFGFFALMLLAPRWLIRPLLAALLCLRRTHLIGDTR